MALTPSLSSVESPMARMAMQNAVGGTATGFTFATVGSLAYGNSLGASVEAGMQGAATGFAAGAITGAGMSIPYARANNVNPFTGRSTLRPILPVVEPLPTVSYSWDKKQFVKHRAGGISVTTNVKSADAFVNILSNAKSNGSNYSYGMNEYPTGTIYWLKVDNTMYYFRYFSSNGAPTMEIKNSFQNFKVRLE